MNPPSEFGDKRHQLPWASRDDRSAFGFRDGIDDPCNAAWVDSARRKLAF